MRTIERDDANHGVVGATISMGRALGMLRLADLAGGRQAPQLTS